MQETPHIGVCAYNNDVGAPAVIFCMVGNLLEKAWFAVFVCVPWIVLHVAKSCMADESYA